MSMPESAVDFIFQKTFQPTNMAVRDYNNYEPHIVATVTRFLITCTCFQSQPHPISISDVKPYLERADEVAGFHSSEAEAISELLVCQEQLIKQLAS